VETYPYQGHLTIIGGGVKAPAFFIIKTREKMSLFLRDKDQVDIGVLGTYAGADEVMQMLSTAYNDVYERFFNNNLGVTFIHPRIKKGEKLLPNIPAVRQESIPWTATIKTKRGDVRIRYCEVAEQLPNGSYKFSPSHLDIEQPKWTYQNTDIDKILFLMVGSKHFLSGAISIVDNFSAETKRAEGRGKNAVVNFHIFSEGGDLYNNVKKLDQFCLSWGISVKDKFEPAKKNALADAIETAEKKKDWKYGYDAFSQAIKDQDPYFEVRANVQDALDKGTIKWNSKQYLVQYKNDETLVKIPIDKSGEWKQYLFEYLSKNPDKLDVVRVTTESEPIHKQRDVNAPDEITEEFIKGDTWNIHDKKRVVQIITGWGYKDLNRMKKPEIESELIKYFVTEGKKMP
jgi:hypothetical protein